LIPRTNLLFAGEVDLPELARADVPADLEVRHAPLLTRRHRAREWAAEGGRRGEERGDELRRRRVAEEEMGNSAGG
jgi:hypothetical protein